MTPPSRGHMSLEPRELGRWNFADSTLILVADDFKLCYTMSYYKYGKLVSEVSNQDQEAGILFVKMLDSLQIDINQLRLN